MAARHGRRSSTWGKGGEAELGDGDGRRSKPVGGASRDAEKVGRRPGEGKELGCGDEREKELGAGEEVGREEAAVESKGGRHGWWWSGIGRVVVEERVRVREEEDAATREIKKRER